MQQEDEYRIQMELNRYYLRKDSLSMGVSSEKSFYETDTARTPSSRGKSFRQGVYTRPAFPCGIRFDLASVKNHLQWRTEGLQVLFCWPTCTYSSRRHVADFKGIDGLESNGILPKGVSE